MKDGSFYLVLSSTAGQAAAKHVDWYESKGLMRKLSGITSLAKYVRVSKSILRDSLQRYVNDSKRNEDQFHKTLFINAPASDMDSETFYAGRVTPVVHYCMGGLSMNSRGQVLNRKREPIIGLFAAGEVTGGLHGDNRLGGNSLLECTVFGRIIGKDTPIKFNYKQDRSIIQRSDQAKKDLAPRINAITASELQQHRTINDCWVAIHGNVYDVTEFAKIHPGGSEMIQKLAGEDVSRVFDALHTPDVLKRPDIQKYQVGILEQEPSHSLVKVM